MNFSHSTVNAQRDMPQLPALAAVLAPRVQFVQAVREELVEEWGVEGPARVRLAAAIGHGLRFETWRSLARGEGLGDEAAADLMVAFAHAAAAEATNSTRRPRKRTVKSVVSGRGQFDRAFAESNRDFTRAGRELTTGDRTDP